MIRRSSTLLRNFVVTDHRRRLSRIGLIVRVSPRKVPSFSCYYYNSQTPFSSGTNVDEDKKKYTKVIHENADAPILTWIDTALPTSWRPYAHLARVDKPIGTFLLLWPCAWSTALAAAPPDMALLGLFAAGAFFMRGAGCTINDLWDQDIDARVRRTALRPLASGAVSRKQAYAFLVAQLTGALGVLVSLPHMSYCVQWCVASLPLVVRLNDVMHVGITFYFSLLFIRLIALFFPSFGSPFSHI